MRFDKLFEGKPWPEIQERLGVMSVDSLDREWELVIEKQGYLIAKSRDGMAVLLGRMGKRDDGKFCIEIVVRAVIENHRLDRYQFWYVDAGDEPQYARWLHEVMRANLDQS
jgi:hypothetical protein